MNETLDRFVEGRVDNDTAEDDEDARSDMQVTTPETYQGMSTPQTFAGRRSVKQRLGLRTTSSARTTKRARGTGEDEFASDASESQKSKQWRHDDGTEISKLFDEFKTKLQNELKTQINFARRNILVIKNSPIKVTIPKDGREKGKLVIEKMQTAIDELTKINKDSATIQNAFFLGNTNRTTIGDVKMVFIDAKPVEKQE